MGYWRERCKWCGVTHAVVLCVSNTEVDQPDRRFCPYWEVTFCNDCGEACADAAAHRCRRAG